MSKILAFCSAVLFFYAIFIPSLHAQEKVQIAYIAVHGPSEYAYLSASIPSIIASRLSSANIIVQTPLKASPPLDSMAKELAVQYILFGTASVVGSSISLDITLMGADKKQYNFPITTTLDGLLSDIEKNIPAMRNVITGGKTVLNTTMEQSATFRPAMKSVWNTSKTLDINPRSIKIMDLDKDGTAEIIVLGDNQLCIYHWKDGEVALVTKKQFSPRLNAMHLSVAELGEGIGTAILVTIMISNRSPYSSVFTYNNGVLQERISGSNYLLGAYYDAKSKKNIPLMQQVDSYPAHFFQAPIYTFSMKGKKILKGNVVPVPEYGNIFTMTTIPTPEGIRTLVLRPSEYIAYYANIKKAFVYSTPEQYSGTTYAFSLLPEEVVTLGTGENQELSYVPMDFVTIPKTDDSVFVFTAQPVDRGLFTTGVRSYKLYTIQALVFNDTAPYVAWKSPHIDGTVAGFDVYDINGDGIQELFVLTGAPPISTPTFKQNRSHILHMPLTTQ